MVDIDLNDAGRWFQSEGPLKQKDLHRTVLWTGGIIKVGYWECLRENVDIDGIKHILNYWWKCYYFKSKHDINQQEI